MDKFLIFIDAADDAAMYPVSSLLGVTVAADATILVKFGSSIQSGGTDGASADIIFTAPADYYNIGAKLIIYIFAHLMI